MAERISKPASAIHSANWKIEGSEISTREEKTKGLEREGNSGEIRDYLERLGFTKAADGTMTMKVQSNTVKRDAKGNVVERRTADGRILTSTEREEAR